MDLFIAVLTSTGQAAHTDPEALNVEPPSLFGPIRDYLQQLVADGIAAAEDGMLPPSPVSSGLRVDQTSTSHDCGCRGRHATTLKPAPA